MDIVDRGQSTGPSDAMHDETRPSPLLGSEDRLDSEDGILKRLRRRKLIFALAFTLVVAAVTGVYVILPRVYKADAIIAIAAPDNTLGGLSGNETRLTIGDTMDLESQAVIVASPMIIRDLLAEPGIRDTLIAECEFRRAPSWKQTIKAKLGLAPRRSCASEFDDTATTVAAVEERLTVGSSPRSRVITVSFSSPLPSVAQKVANGVVRAYMGAEEKEKLQPRDQAIAWLQAELQRVSSRLESTEAQIQAFLHANGVVNGQKGPIASEQLTNLAALLAQAEADQAAASGRLQQARAGSLTAGALDNRAVSDIKQQLATVSGQLALLSARYGSAAPQVTELDQQQRTLQRMLVQETSAVTRSATTDYQAATDRVASLTQQVEALKQDVRGSDDASTQVASLQRSAATDHDLYLDLSRGLNKLQTERRLVTTNVHLVSLAEFPQRVFFPKPSSFVLAGLLLAVAAGVLCALGSDRIDRTLRAASSLSDHARMRVLTHIPHVSRIGRGSARVAKRIENPSEFQEAIRILYAECLLLGSSSRSSRPRSIMFTSADSGDGKSTVILALGHFAAAASQRVLILELDLRRPSIARSMSLPVMPGVTDVLRGTAQYEEAISHPRASLDVMAAGTPTMISTELLGGIRLRQLLTWATASYDLVLIDAPASRTVPDARILARDVDRVIYCARWGHSKTAYVATGATEIRMSGGRIMGLVLNQVGRAHYSHYDDSRLPAGTYPAALQA